MEFLPGIIVGTSARIPLFHLMVFVAFRSPCRVDAAAQTVLLDVLPTTFYMRVKERALYFSSH
jgi:hypothetical protein